MESLPLPCVLAPQTVSGKSKYGMPIFLPNGNINPAYLAAERKEMAAPFMSPGSVRCKDT